MTDALVAVGLILGLCVAVPAFVYFLLAAMGEIR